MSTQKQKTSTKYCIFCRYWDGNKATRSNQHEYWEFSFCYAKCGRNKQRVSATHSCREFELDTFTYYD